ncbi:MAG: hypothetical protein NVS2B12_17470 [Ktedonobacteraceae bacterium]
MTNNKTKLTWRDLLKNLTSDPQEQQRIIEALGINAMTLRRWINNETNPRPQNLRLLLNALPHYRKQLVTLLAVEFPLFKKEAVEPDYNDVALISAEFYSQLIGVYAGVAQHLRTSTVSKLILQQIVKQFDPDMDGLLIMIAQCTFPTAGHKVRSLRLVEGRGTPPWDTYTECHSRLFGAEALIGHAVSSKHLTVLASGKEYQRAFPYDQIEGVESVAAAPIVFADRTAGGIYVASAQPNYFSPVYISLLQQYVELLCLAFERDEFFLLSEIELGIMPSSTMQFPTLVTFQARVTQQMLQAVHENRAITRTQAERVVWQQIENEFLHLGPE